MNHNIVQSQIEGGVFLDGLQPATVLQIRTQHHRYKAILLGGSRALISGHPTYCPHPVLVAISGSTWGGSMLKIHFVGRRMHLIDDAGEDVLWMPFADAVRLGVLPSQRHPAPRTTGTATGSPR